MHEISIYIVLDLVLRAGRNHGRVRVFIDKEQAMAAAPYRRAALIRFRVDADQVGGKPGNLWIKRGALRHNRSKPEVVAA